MSSDQFSQVFRDEHRKIRDALLDLIVAFQERDKARVQTMLQETAAYTGPHFRYEEEALYPSLVEFFGEEYIEKLLQDHDQAIGSARKLVGLAGKEQLNNEDVTEAIRLIRTVLPHVSDCEGLSIMVERWMRFSLFVSRRIKPESICLSGRNSSGVGHLPLSTDPRQEGGQSLFNTAPFASSQSRPCRGVGYAGS